MTTKITKEEVAEKIKEVDNILIITSSSPKIDQLSSSLALAEILHDLDKNSVIVHSEEPSTAVKFLKPENVIQKDAESLRDFIVSFKRDKVDKLRYTQEGDQYDILLTPVSRQIITDKDIEYRTGDFNIDLIIAVGIENKGKIDSVISKHAQLINDIPMVNIVAGKKSSGLEAMSWRNESVPSVAEMIYELSQCMDENYKLNKQSANALLMGIVDQTERYKNRQTKAQTMRFSAELIELGADLSVVNENLALDSAKPISIPEAENTQQMVAEAVGEAGKYDTQLIKNKKKKTSGKSQRLHIRQGDLEKQEGVSIGEKIKELKEEDEHHPDQINIDAAGNLKIISEEDDQPVVAEQPALTAHQDQPEVAQQAVPESSYQDSPAPVLAENSEDSQRFDKKQRLSLTPSSEAEALSPPPIGSNESIPEAPSIADLNPQLDSVLPQPPVEQIAAPSISEIVDRTADNNPAVPGLNEKVADLSPLNSDTDNYIDSLMNVSDVQTQADPPNLDPNQAMTVDNYLTQQQPQQQADPSTQLQAPMPANPSIGSDSLSPPVAPPLASMT